MMMLKSRADFVKRAGKDNKAVEKAKARVERSIRLLFKSYSGQVKALIRNPKLFTRSKQFDVAVLSETIADLTDLLQQAGMDDLVGSYIDEFPDITTQAREYFEQFGDLPKLGGTSAEALDTYIDFSERRLRQTVDRALVQPLQEGLFHATFGNMSRGLVIDTIASLTDDLSDRQVNTLVDDTFRQYQRAVTNTTAEELGMDVFWYQGPDDAITSGQCEHILNDDPHGVPGMYYRDEISIDMHEKLRDDPFVAGGHPNCRHKFYPVTLEFAKEQGFKA